MDFFFKAWRWRAWQHTPLISVLRSRSKWIFGEFAASLIYIMSSRIARTAS